MADDIKQIASILIRADDQASAVIRTTGVAVSQAGAAVDKTAASVAKSNTFWDQQSKALAEAKVALGQYALAIKEGGDNTAELGAKWEAAKVKARGFQEALDETGVAARGVAEDIKLAFGDEIAAAMQRAKITADELAGAIFRDDKAVADFALTAHLAAVEVEGMVVAQRQAAGMLTSAQFGPAVPVGGIGSSVAAADGATSAQKRLRDATAAVVEANIAERDATAAEIGEMQAAQLAVNRYADAQAKAAILANATTVATLEQKTALDALSLNARVALQGLNGYNAGLLISKGNLLALGGALAIVSVVEFANFQTEMIHLQGNTGATAAQMRYLSAQVLAMGQSVPAPLTDIADAFRHASDEGYRLAAGVSVVHAASDAFLITGGNLGDESNALAIAMHDWGIQSQFAEQTMGILVTAAQRGNETVPDLVNNLGRVGAVASAVHMGISATTAALSTLTQATGNASQAQTQLLNILVHIISPTSKAQQVMEELRQATGVDLSSAFQSFSQGQLSFLNLMEKVKQATGDNVGEQEALFGGMRGGTGAVILLNGHLSTLSDTMDKNAGSTKRLRAEADAAKNSFGNQFHQAVNNAKVGLIEMFDSMTSHHNVLTDTTAAIIHLHNAVQDLGSSSTTPVKVQVASIQDEIAQWKQEEINIRAAGKAGVDQMQIDDGIARVKQKINALLAEEAQLLRVSTTEQQRNNAALRDQIALLGRREGHAGPPAVSVPLSPPEASAFYSKQQSAEQDAANKELYDSTHQGTLSLKAWTAEIDRDKANVIDLQGKVVAATKGFNDIQKPMDDAINAAKKSGDTYTAESLQLSKAQEAARNEFLSTGHVTAGTAANIVKFSGELDKANKVIAALTTPTDALAAKQKALAQYESDAANQFFGLGHTVTPELQNKIKASSKEIADWNVWIAKITTTTKEAAQDSYQKFQKALSDTTEKASVELNNLGHITPQTAGKLATMTTKANDFQIALQLATGQLSPFQNKVNQAQAALQKATDNLAQHPDSAGAKASYDTAKDKVDALTNSVALLTGGTTQWNLDLTAAQTSLQNATDDYNHDRVTLGDHAAATLLAKQRMDDAATALGVLTDASDKTSKALQVQADLHAAHITNRAYQASDLLSDPRQQDVYAMAELHLEGWAQDAAQRWQHFLDRQKKFGDPRQQGTAANRALGSEVAPTAADVVQSFQSIAQTNLDNAQAELTLKLNDQKNHIQDTLPPLSTLRKNVEDATKAVDGLAKAAANAARGYTSKSTYDTYFDPNALPSNFLLGGQGNTVAGPNLADAAKAGDYNTSQQALANDAIINAANGQIEELRHQSAMIGLNTSLSADAKAIAQAQLQVQQDSQQILIDQLNLDIAKASNDPLAIAAAQNTLTKDQNKSAEDTAGLGNAQARATLNAIQAAVNNATKAIQDGNTIAADQRTITQAIGAVQTAQLSAIAQHTQDMASVLSASGAVDQAVANKQLSQIIDMTAVIQAQGQLQINTINLQAKADQDLLKNGPGALVGYDMELLKATQQMNEEQIALARAKMQADAAKADAAIKIAQDGVRIAQDKMMADDHANAWNIKLAQDNVDVAKAQLKVEMDTQALNVAMLKEMDAANQANSVNVKLPQDIDSLVNKLSSDNASLQGHLKQQGDDTLSAAQQAARDAMIQALDALGLAGDQNTAGAIASQWDILIATIEQSIAGQDNLVQALQATASAVADNTKAQDVQALLAVIKTLRDLFYGRNLAGAAPHLRGSTTAQQWDRQALQTTVSPR